MPIWPFRRKTSRKKARSAADGFSSAMRETGQENQTGRHNGSNIGRQGIDQSSGPRPSRVRRSSREPKKLHRDPERRAYSFSPGRNDTIRVPKDIHKEHPVQPLPESAATAPNLNHLAESSEYAGQDKVDKDWQRVPTLYRRSNKELAHRKSSKKRKEGDRDREAELKAMSFQMPGVGRVSTLQELSGKPVRRETKRMRGINRIFTNPASDVSLPLQESIHSSLSSNSENHTSYELKGIDVFAPRPTIRYSENQRYIAGASGFASDGSDGKRKRISERIALPEETIREKMRIDELADDFDAGDLRELLERDQRRREKKKIADQQKMERRLARRAEKQRLAEAEAKRNGTQPPKNMDRGVFGRELGLGIDTEATLPATQEPLNISDRPEPLPLRLDRGESSATTPAPLGDDFHRSASLPPTEAGSPTDEREEPVVSTAQVARLSRANVSPPSSPKGHTRGSSNISQMLELNKVTGTPSVPVQADQLRRNSETSVRQPQSWTSFFKRSSRSKGEAVPSSFSNTSRDSMPTPQALPTSYAPPRASTGVPKRTLSKFREDLPELPLSPPDSRVQSPEADIPSPARAASSPAGRRFMGRHQAAKPLAEPITLLRHDTPTSDQRDIEVESPETVMTLSQSLASVDSEGSWLSGRPRTNSKRTNLHPARHPQRDSSSTMRQRYKDYSDSAEDELGITEDEYFNRLTPGPEDYDINQKHRRKSGNPMPSSDEEDRGSLASPSGSQKSKWGAVGRQATVVHTETRAKSREGLLNAYNDYSEEETSGESHHHDLKDEDVGNNEEQTIQRATSIDLGRRHARHISAGSARLLELKPRASEDSKRISSG